MMHATNTPEENKDIVKGLIFGLLLIALMAVIAMSSCTTSRKATSYMIKHPAVGADYCAVQWPCKDSVFERILIKEGETIVKVDSFTNTDTVVAVDTVFITKTKIVRRDIAVHDTVERTRVIYQTDKAKQAALVIAAQKLSHRYHKAVIWALMGWGIIMLLIVIVAGRWYFKSMAKFA